MIPFKDLFHGFIYGTLWKVLRLICAMKREHVNVKENASHCVVEVGTSIVNRRIWHVLALLLLEANIQYSCNHYL